MRLFYHLVKASNTLTCSVIAQYFSAITFWFSSFEMPNIFSLLLNEVRTSRARRTEPIDSPSRRVCVPNSPGTPTFLVKVLFSVWKLYLTLAILEIALAFSTISRRVSSEYNLISYSNSFQHLFAGTAV